jgi:PAS domain S-box-containing protein
MDRSKPIESRAHVNGDEGPSDDGANDVLMDDGLARIEAMSREELVRHIESIETDNARLREAQVELASLGARYMDLFEASPVPYVVLDDAGIIRQLNKETAALLGEEMWQLRGRSLSRFVAAKERRSFNEHVQSSSEAPSTRATSMVVTLQLKNAKPMMIRLVSRSLHQGAMPFAGVRTVLVDVSDEKRGEEELRLAVRMREDFLAVVAHDLRSPLAAIVMSAELLERRSDKDGRDIREIDRIRRSTMRMNRLVADLLDLSSMEAGRLAMEPALEDVQGLIVAALEIASPLAARKNISLSAHVDGEFVEAWCDRERVIQVLLNLITNAVKYTSTGSVSVRAKRSAGEVHFAVHDTGKGLSRAQIDHIFDPYWQVSPNAREGTGLGLSIVKGIVQLHGGRVWAESRPGRGSSFSFTLPRHAPGTAPTDVVEVAAPLPRPSLATLTDGTPEPERTGPLVMLIDDEGSVRESISEALRGEGYDVIAVPHGRAALDYLDGASVMPSLILLDLVMPVMDGWEFLRQQSRAPRLAGVPVVLVSAQAEQQQQQQQRGAEQAAVLAGFIQKPVRLARLCEVVGSCAAVA